MRRLNKRFDVRVRLKVATRQAMTLVYAVTCLGVPLPVSAHPSDVPGESRAQEHRCRCDTGAVLAEQCCCTRVVSCCAPAGARRSDHAGRGASRPDAQHRSADHSTASARGDDERELRRGQLNSLRCQEDSTTSIQVPPSPTLIELDDVLNEPAPIGWMVAESSVAPPAFLPPPTPPPPPKLFS